VLDLLAHLAPELAQPFGHPLAHLAALLLYLARARAVPRDPLELERGGVAVTDPRPAHGAYRVSGGAHSLQAPRCQRDSTRSKADPIG
jgi:hypothetical protein